MQQCARAQCRTKGLPEGGSLLCAACITWFTALLRDTEAHIAVLTTERRATGSSERGNFGYGSSSPAADHVIAMLDPRSSANAVNPDDEENPPLSVAVLGEWARRVGWRGGTVRDAVSALLISHQWITAQPWVLDLLDELSRLHRQVAAAAGDAPPRPVASCTLLINGVVCGGDVVQVDRVEPGAGLSTPLGARCLRCAQTYSGTDLVRLRVAQGLRDEQEGPPRGGGVLR